MSKFLLAINGAALLGSAIFITNAEIRYIIITALLLFLPLLDSRTKEGYFHAFNQQNYVWLIIACCYLFLLLFHASYTALAVSILLLTALPEEWFFRYYFLQRLELFSANLWVTNAICSVFFATLHLPTQGVTGLLTFFPSLCFGYVFQRSRNLPLVILLHGLANLFYVIYLRNWLYG